MPYGRFFANEWLNERLFTNALGLQLLWIFEGAAGGHQPYDAKQQSIGGEATVGAGYSASVSYSNSKAKGDFASVTEQTGIQAGSGGFQVNVKGNTDLKGAVIASTQEAVDNKLNRLSTGTLTHSDLENHSDHDASAFSVAGGFSVAGKASDSKGGEGGKGSESNSGMKLYNPPKTGVTGAGFGVSSDSGNENSTTRSSISQAEITITDEIGQQALTGQSAAEAIASIHREALTGDDANGLTKTWDGQALMQEQAANAQIMAEFGKQAGQAIGNEFTKKAQSLYNQAKLVTGEEKRALEDEAKKWDEGGIYRVAAHTAAGALGGGLGGALGAAASSAAAPLLNQLQDKIAQNLESAGLSQDAAKMVGQMVTGVTATGLGTAVGGATGAMTAGNADFNNRQLHHKEKLRIKELAKDKAQKMCQGDADCFKSANLYWTDMLERAAEGRVDTQDAIKNQTHYQKIIAAAGKSDSEASRGAAQSFFEDLTQAHQMLDADAGKLIVDSRGAPLLGTDGKPQTYFSATQEQRDNPYGNVFPGGSPNTQPFMIPDREYRDQKRLGYMNSINGQAQTDTTVEEALSDLIPAVRGIKSVVKVTGRSAGAALPGTLKSVEEALLKSGGAFDHLGRPILDLKLLTNDQKRVMGELFGENLTKQIVPEGQKLARIQGAGTTGIDDLYKVNRPDVDYLVIEYKFVGKNTGKGSHDLKDRSDGRQGSKNWILGSDRLEKAVGVKRVDEVTSSIKSNRYETWVVTTRPDGSTIIEVLDAAGKTKSVDTSKILIKGLNISGAMP